MLSKVYAVYDSKTFTYGSPFLMKHIGDAVRAFTQIANDVTSQIGLYPEDYTLFELGTFDDQTAFFSILPNPIHVGKAIEFVRRKSGDVCDISGAALQRVS